MKDQRRFAPEGGRIESESVAGLAGISTLPLANNITLQKCPKKANEY